MSYKVSTAFESYYSTFTDSIRLGGWNQESVLINSLPEWSPMQPDKTILVVTNDSNVRNNLMIIVEEKGYFTTVLNQGSEVILAVLDQKIDLIILDLDLEGMSGLEIIPIIKKTRPKIPIIVISGDNSIKTGG